MKVIYKPSSEVRSHFSETIDKAVYDKPQFIKRTHDQTVLLSTELLSAVLTDVSFICDVQKEENGSYVITNREIDDIIGVGATIEEAKDDLAKQLLEYAHEYYEEYGLYSRSPNRKKHLTYVLKLLAINDFKRIKGLLNAEVE